MSFSQNVSPTDISLAFDGSKHYVTSSSPHQHHQVTILKNFFPSSLMTRPNKVDRLSLETLSNQVLEFEGKARANPIGAPFRCFLLG
jgi:hypothetical protein